MSEEASRQPFDGPRSPMVWLKNSLPFLALVGAGVLVLVILRSGGGEDRRSFTLDPSRELPSIGSVVVARLGSIGPGFDGASVVVAREAGRIAASNPIVARLVRLGDGRQVGTAGPWKASGGKLKLKGAVLAYTLKRPVPVNLDLPYVAIPPDAPSHGNCVQPYAPGWAHLSAPGVTALMVLVDLRRQQVVQITTNATRGSVSPVAGKPYPTCNEDQG